MLNNILTDIIQRKNNTNQYEIGEEIFDHAIVLGRFDGEGKSGFGVVWNFLTN